MIPTEKILPTLLIVIDVLAAIGYIPSMDFKNITYWGAAAVLTFAVTWM